MSLNGVGGHLVALGVERSLDGGRGDSGSRLRMDAFVVRRSHTFDCSLERFAVTIRQRVEQSPDHATSRERFHLGLESVC